MSTELPIRSTGSVTISFDKSRTARLENQLDELLRSDGDEELAAAATTAAARPTPGRVSEAQRKQAEALKEAGNKFFARQQYREAIEQYTQAIGVDPHNSVFYSNRATSWLKLDDARQALLDATTAADIDPANVKAFLRRSAANEALDRLVEALQDATTCLQLDPQSDVFRALVARLEKKLLAAPRTAVARMQQDRARDDTPVLVSSTRLSTSSTSSSIDPILSSKQTSRPSIEQASSSRPLIEPIHSSELLIEPIRSSEQTTSSSHTSPSKPMLLEPSGPASSPFLLEPSAAPPASPFLLDAPTAELRRAADPRPRIPASFSSMSQFEPVWLEIEAAGDLDALFELWSRLATGSLAAFFGDMLSADLLQSFLRAVEHGQATGKLDRDAVQARIQAIRSCSRFDMLRFFLSRAESKSLLAQFDI